MSSKHRRIKTVDLVCRTMCETVRWIRGVLTVPNSTRTSVARYLVRLSAGVGPKRNAYAGRPGTGREKPDRDAKTFSVPIITIYTGGGRGEFNRFPGHCGRTSVPRLRNEILSRLSTAQRIYNTPGRGGVSVGDSAGG